jgi:hypothetical protein
MPSLTASRFNGTCIELADINRTVAVAGEVDRFQQAD